MANRRSFLQNTLGLGAGLFAGRTVAHASPSQSIPVHQVADKGGYLGVSSRSLSKLTTHDGPVFNVPVVTTDVGDLPFETDGDVKVFRLTAQVFRRQIAPDKTIDVWGFNGSAPGPTIQVTQGDRIRVIFKNELPEASSIHWHGFEDPIGYDGMPGISQEPVRPGQTFVYEFTLHQEGTYFYHSHMAMQEMAGMLGAVIMHPRVPYRPHCDKDFVIHLQQYSVLPNSTTPDTMSMDWNWLLLNGKAGPSTTPLVVRQGERVRIRFINLGMQHHPMHIHGHTFYVTGTEGGRIAETAWWPGNTVLVGVAQARNVEFVADNPGDWMLHCHLPHHMMNQMASQAGPMTRPMAGMAGTSMQSSGPVGDSAVPSAALGGGRQATDPAGALSDTQLNAGMMGMLREQNGGQMKLSPLQQHNLDAFDMSGSSMQAQRSEISPNAENVPNFPQDAYMEGPMMNMDALVEKPENLGLRLDWSRFMQGMMTFVRVLPPEQYDRVVAAMSAANRPGDPYASLYTPVGSDSRG
jgi:FtsP/CotA-like multicopper oxidase with cupredoxin domain